MNELFDPKQVESKSPRLRWMEKHDVKTFMDEGEYYAYIHSELVTWDKPIPKRVYSGDTESNALINLACNNNWKTWLEEGWENE